MLHKVPSGGDKKTVGFLSLESWSKVWDRLEKSGVLDRQVIFKARMLDQITKGGKCGQKRVLRSEPVSGRKGGACKGQEGEKEERPATQEEKQERVVLEAD